MEAKQPPEPAKEIPSASPRPKNLLPCCSGGAEKKKRKKKRHLSSDSLTFSLPQLAAFPFLLSLSKPPSPARLFIREI